MANERARRLRKSMTPQEVKLWNHLRSWKSRGFHFRRQAPRDGYILDFVCLRHKLIVEVDGGQHGVKLHAARDGSRDRHFARREFRTLRFWNSDIDCNLSGVLQTIDNELIEMTPTRPASPAALPRGGEG